MANIDPYVVLGIGPDATPEQVRAAFRKAVVHAHPDTSATMTSPASVRRVIDAYRLLADPIARAQYDVVGSPATTVDPHATRVPVRRSTTTDRQRSSSVASCPGCRGMGFLRSVTTCPSCRGRAEITELEATHARVMRCRTCRGSGRIGLRRTCEICRGIGVVTTTGI